MIGGRSRGGARTATGRASPAAPSGGRFATVASTVFCVLGVVGGLLVAGSGTAPAIAVADSGHWVYNQVAGSVLHVDGGTGQVDARVDLPERPPEPLFTVQGESQGFLVARDRVVVFGKSTLTVDSTFPVGHAEVPVPIEVVGGPYLVYREAGTVVRLGPEPVTIPLGSRLDRPVWTDDGTVWVQRTDGDELCAVRRDADRPDCSVQAPGTPGDLAVTGDRPAFVATDRDSAQLVDQPGPAVGLGTDLAGGVLIADRDTLGTLPAVDPAANRLQLVDTAGVPAGVPGGPGRDVGLGPGRFTAPVAAHGVVALLEETGNRLLTYDTDGVLLADTPLPAGTGPAVIARGGDGRIYVDDRDGATTHVVGEDGSVTSVPTGGSGAGAAGISPVAAAAPVRRRVSVAVPPAGPGTGGGVVLPPGATPLPPGANPPPGGNPVPPVPNPPGPNPNPPVPELPTAPGNVRALVTGPDGALDVSWSAADGRGLPVEYEVLGNGAVLATTGALAATLDGLDLGTPYAITVRARSTAGTGPSAAAAGSVTPYGPAAAPTGLAVAAVGYPAQYEVTWNEPDLRGGEPNGYVVQIGGGEAFPVTGTTYRDPDRVCAPSVTYTVFASTSPPASEVGPGLLPAITGDPATVTFSAPAGCTPDVEIAASGAGGPGAIYVQVACSSALGEAATGTLSLLVDGVVRRSRPCTAGGFGPGAADTIDGLAPATAYTVRAEIDGPGGVKESTTVTVTTDP